MKTLSIVCVMAVMAVLLAVFPAFAKNEVGSIVALRGKATIERGGGHIDAKVKGSIEPGDTIVTAAGGKAKLLFIDDSVLTIAESSRVNVTEFIHSKENHGKSIFNLIDGKMRTVVGKTKFEVVTPTSVAAARGTVIFFEVGTRNGLPYAIITCHEGVVDIKSLIPGFPGTAVLTPGMGITVVSGQPFPVPVQVPVPELQKQKSNLSTAGSEVTVSSATDQSGGTPNPAGQQTGKVVTDIDLTKETKPLVTQTPPRQPIGVNIGVGVKGR